MCGGFEYVFGCLGIDVFVKGSVFVCLDFFDYDFELLDVVVVDVFYLVALLFISVVIIRMSYYIRLEFYVY